MWQYRQWLCWSQRSGLVTVMGDGGVGANNDTLDVLGKVSSDWVRVGGGVDADQLWWW